MGLVFLSMPGLIMSDNDVRQPIVSIVSTGQMGAAFGARLQTNGVRVITPDGRAARALAAGIEIVPLAEIGDSDFIFSIVPPAVAVGTARKVAAVLAKGTGGPLYIDWNAVSPARAQEIEDVIVTAGGRFADGCIIKLGPLFIILLRSLGENPETGLLRQSLVSDRSWNA